jgi:hypothetical protein
MLMITDQSIQTVLLAWRGKWGTKSGRPLYLKKVRFLHKKFVYTLLHIVPKVKNDSQVWLVLA